MEPCYQKWVQKSCFDQNQQNPNWLHFGYAFQLLFDDRPPFWKIAELVKFWRSCSRLAAPLTTGIIIFGRLISDSNNLKCLQLRDVSTSPPFFRFVGSKVCVILCKSFVRLRCGLSNLQKPKGKLALLFFRNPLPIHLIIKSSRDQLAAADVSLYIHISRSTWAFSCFYRVPLPFVSGGDDALGKTEDLK